MRFHPACYYRADDEAPLEAWPALIAAVTDLSGNVTGVLRTWLARDGSAKAPIANPRRAMGELFGHAVRFGAAQDVLAAGEGVETMLSLKSVLPDLPMVAALSASHLAALLLPPSLRRLYVAADNDAAGRHAATRLTERARDAQIEAHLLLPRADDWNTDVRALTSRMMFQDVAAQLAAADAARFLCPTDGPAVLKTKSTCQVLQKADGIAAAPKASGSCQKSESIFGLSMQRTRSSERWHDLLRNTLELLEHHSLGRAQAGAEVDVLHARESAPRAS